MISEFRLNFIHKWSPNKEQPWLLEFYFWFLFNGRQTFIRYYLINDNRIGECMNIQFIFFTLLLVIQKNSKLNFIIIPMQISMKEELDLICIKFSYFGIIYFLHSMFWNFYISTFTATYLLNAHLYLGLFTRQKFAYLKHIPFLFDRRDHILSNVFIFFFIWL